MNKREFVIPLERCLNYQEKLYNKNQYDNVAIDESQITIYNNQTIKNVLNYQPYTINGSATYNNFVLNSTAPTGGELLKVCFKRHIYPSSYSDFFIKTEYNDSVDELPSGSTTNHYRYIEYYYKFSGTIQLNTFDNLNISGGATIYSGNYDSGEDTYNFVSSYHNIWTPSENVFIKRLESNETLSLNSIDYFLKGIQYSENQYYYADGINQKGLKNHLLNNVYKAFFVYKINGNQMEYLYLFKISNDFRQYIGNDIARYIKATRTTDISISVKANYVVYNDAIQKNYSISETTNNAFKLSSNDFINNNSLIENEPLADVLVRNTYSYYMNGIDTIELKLPIIPLYDQYGVQKTLNNSYIEGNGLMSGDIIYLEKNNQIGTTQYLITNVETTYDGNYRWNIKAKKNKDITTLTPLANFVPVIGAKNIGDGNFDIGLTDESETRLLEIVQQMGIDITNLELGVVVRRHNTQKGKYSMKDGYKKYKVTTLPYGKMFSITFKKFKGGNDEDEYSYIDLKYDYATNDVGNGEIVTYLKLYGLVETFSSDVYLRPRRIGKYRVRKTSKYANILPLGICFRYGNIISQLSSNCIIKTDTGIFNDRNEPLECVYTWEQYYEFVKKRNFTT